MAKKKTSGPVVTFSSRLCRFSAVVAVTLLLTVQVGLAFHSASHLHGAGEAGDCSLCILCTNFIAEPATYPNLTSYQPVCLLGLDSATAFVDTPLQNFPARGPPAFPV